jgi:hypothetical protein
MTQLVPVINQPSLYINNMQVTVASNTTLGVAAGQCRDSNNVIDIVLDEAVVINAAVNGINGLDTGTFAASTWYYVHVIADSSANKPVGCILSLSRTAPTLPFGYDSFRWIGVERADGSVHFLARYVAGNSNYRNHVWDANISALSSGAASTLTAISLTASVPPIDNLPVTLQVGFTPAIAGQYVGFAPFGSTATALAQISSVVVALTQRGQLRIMSKLDTVTKILYINSAGSCTTDVSVDGFEYFL